MCEVLRMLGGALVIRSELVRGPVVGGFLKLLVNTVLGVLMMLMCWQEMALTLSSSAFYMTRFRRLLGCIPSRALVLIVVS